MKAEILQINERIEYPAPGKRVVQVEILYRTEKGYTGTVILPKDGLTDKAIKEAIRADAETVNKAIGSHIEV